MEVIATIEYFVGSCSVLADHCLSPFWARACLLSSYGYDLRMASVPVVGSPKCNVISLDGCRLPYNCMLVALCTSNATIQ